MLGCFIFDGGREIAKFVVDSSMESLCSFEVGIALVLECPNKLKLIVFDLVLPTFTSFFVQKVALLLLCDPLEEMKCYLPRVQAAFNS